MVWLIALSICERTLEAVRRHFSIRVEFDSRDDSFRWILEWLAHNKYAIDNSGSYIATSNANKLYGFSHGNGHGKDIDHEVQLTPGQGTHWLTTSNSNKWVFIKRSVNGQKENRQERIVVTMLGSKRAYLDSFIEEARVLCKERDLSRTLIYSGGEHGSWNMAQSKTRRPMKSVILADNKAMQLLGDINNFLSSKAWYTERGIPWRRGYLLYGPPGSGKTSFVTAVAGETGMNIYSVSLGSAGMSDDALQSLMNCAPQRSIILMEDVDAAFMSGIEDEQKGEKKTGSLLSLSGLLNAMDGVASQEGSLLFLTTNNPDMLPKRLIRSGRIDVQMAFEHATKEQAQSLFEAFYPQCEKDMARQCRELFKEGNIAMSDLQSLFIKHKNDPKKAIEELQNMGN